jgi:hypothetical protein
MLTEDHWFASDRLWQITGCQPGPPPDETIGEIHQHQGSRLVDDPDTRLSATARANIAAWLEHEAATSYHGPHPEQAVHLDPLIEHARPILGAHRADLLRFHAGLPTPGAP